ncbi:MAG: RHS repeat-associated core domain-containing protein, partial [Kiritimatiellae bacterium]|nr:RHS repeat-associated core domain-containing protein [Kiritimatiellia bacterium]
TVYVWGTDLSGSMQGAGGVGGLLAVKRNGVWYAPLYDANGNVTAYVSESGAVVAEYEYDAFGATISQSGMMADSFRHRFSTKPWIAALGVYDYGERLYSPELRRWMSRDPIEEEGGVNLYAFCNNFPMLYSDIQGEFPAIVVIPAGALARIMIKAAIKAAVTAAIAFSTAIAIKDKCKRCRPCDPPGGTIGCRVDVVPPSKPHYPHKGTHTHLSVVMQSPPDVCKCSLHKIEIRGGVDIPLGAVPMVGTPRGGGVD